MLAGRGGRPSWWPPYRSPSRSGWGCDGPKSWSAWGCWSFREIALDGRTASYNSLASAFCLRGRGPWSGTAGDPAKKIVENFRHQLPGGVVGFGKCRTRLSQCGYVGKLIHPSAAVRARGFGRVAGGCAFGVSAGPVRSDVVFAVCGAPGRARNGRADSPDG